MKKVKITANELDESEEWLKDVDTNETPLPMLLASYGHDIRLSRFPALNNLSDEISNLAEKIKGIQIYDFVSIRLSEYNNLRDFKSSVLSLFHGILGSNKEIYNRLTVYDLCDIINKEIQKKQPIKNNSIRVSGIVLFVLFFIAGLVCGGILK